MLELKGQNSTMLACNGLGDFINGVTFIGRKTPLNSGLRYYLGIEIKLNVAVNLKAELVSHQENT